MQQRLDDFSVSTNDVLAKPSFTIKPSFREVCTNHIHLDYLENHLFYIGDDIYKIDIERFVKEFGIKQNGSDG